MFKYLGLVCIVMEAWGYLVGVVVLIAGVFGGFLGFGGDVGEEGIRVASFNGQIFGDSKIDKVGVDYYVDLIRGYDLFFLLEIRDKDGSSFDAVCDELVDYNYSCFVSERAGRSSSKEQVGVVWDSARVNVSSVYSLNDSEDVFEREPVIVGTDFGHEFWVVHLKPDDVVSEMSALEDVVKNRSADYADGADEGVVLIGDFNADCSYYSERAHFLDWRWLIGDEVDTTTGRTDCAYDRVVVSDSVNVIGSGVVEIEGEVSDHHLVFVEIGE